MAGAGDTFPAYPRCWTIRACGEGGSSGRHAAASGPSSGRSGIGEFAAPAQSNARTEHRGWHPCDAEDSACFWRGAQGWSAGPQRGYLLLQCRTSADAGDDQSVRWQFPVRAATARIRALGQCEGDRHTPPPCPRMARCHGDRLYRSDDCVVSLQRHQRHCHGCLWQAYRGCADWDRVCWATTGRGRGVAWLPCWTRGRRHSCSQRKDRRVRTVQTGVSSRRKPNKPEHP